MPSRHDSKPYQWVSKEPRSRDRCVPNVEHLEPRDLPSVVLFVTNTADGGAGSLRQAIGDANATSGPVEIRFTISTSALNADVDSGLGGDAAADVAVIRPASALPPLTNPFGVQLDARTQTTLIGNTNPFGPEVVLDGILAGAGVAGLTLQSNGNGVFGLNVQRFGGNGVNISGVDQNWIAGNSIGTNATGTAAAANGGHGVQINGGAASNLVGTNGDGNSDFDERNVISGNAFTGLRIEGAGTDGNVVAGNVIGTNAAATGAIANGTHGIRITNGARFTRVGTDGGVNGGAEWNIISGNTSNGVMIDGAATTQTVVAGNYIGTNGGGTAALPNAQGVYIDAGTSNNTVGNPAVAGNLISGNFFNGVVLLNGATGNLVSTNWIGMDRTGAGDLGNNDDGVHVLNAPGNTISNNLISGNNRNGVWLWQSGSGGNVVSFNQIGTDIGGTLDRGNGGDGVRIESAPGNTVGGNVISGNNSDGVEVTGGGATGNWLSGNSIGTNAAGTSAIGNTGFGVLVQNNAANTRIGTDANGVNDSGERNVISGNFLGVGVYSGASATTIAGNYMGTNAAGTAAIPNADDAVFMNGANGVVIGGPAAAARNLASGNNGDGLEFFNSTGVVIQGNYVGTNFDGTAAIRNRFYGVRVPQSAGGVITGNLISGNGDLGLELWGPATANTTVSGNLIGVNAAGTAALPNGTIGAIGGVWVRNGASNNTITGNVVSGNVGSGVRLDDASTTGNAVTGNRIGTNAAGTASVSNTRHGVRIFNAPGNTIGGTTAASRNVISGNTGTPGDSQGVDITGATATGNLIQGNYIGVNAAGTAALGNAGDGVSIYNGAHGNTVGGTVAGAGNVISGNGRVGVWLSGGGNNLVAGNLIGTNAAGTAAIGNGQVTALPGVLVQSGNNTIGGTTAAARNVISGNLLHGVQLTGVGTSGNVVLGNRIGTNAAGTAGLGNAVNGVQIDGGAANNTVGGGTSAARNLISGNGLDGVFIIAATDNRVQGNYVGTNAAGSGAVGNGRIGVLLWPGAARNVIGTDGNGVADAGEGNLVSGNATHGIEIRGAGSNQNVVAGNLVGTDLNGNADLGNGANGVFVWEGAQSNRVGTDGNGVSDAAERNVISGNAGSGVEIRNGGTNGNVVAGNHIGTNLAGTASLGNSLDGVTVIGGASNNTVGGSTAAARNLISGNNSDGIEINGATTTGNVVAGNRIGTDVNGAFDLGNALDGVLINGSANTTVGGPTAAAGNVISGNNSVGVRVQTAGASGNTIQNNFIGTNATGGAAVGNSFAGVFLAAGTQTTSLLSNVVAGNGTFGVRINGASNNVLSVNRIGTNATGTAAVANLDDGVRIDGGAGNNTIGGTAAGAGNLISGNGDDGIEINGSGTTGTVVVGNRIGTNAAGDAALGNADLAGINIIGSPNNTIGGTASTARNVISGNALLGVSISGATATGNRLLGNYVGLDAGGTFAIPNGSDGVRISAASGNTIGGTASGSGNVISGNAFDGIDIRLGATNNLVQGNLVGTDFSGSAAVGNGGSGVNIEAAAGNTTGNTVGGTAPGARNVISGNLGVGVLLFTSGTGQVTGNSVLGNYVGTDVTGTADLGNGSDGVRISDATGNTVGGSTAAARNVISGNDGDGIEITGVGTTGNLVAGNYVGTDAGGSADLGNLVNGVHITGGAFNNTVGGTTAAARNVISGNDGRGVLIIDADTTGNVVSGNFIGTDVSGALDLGNTSHGVRIENASGNTVGGSAASAGNVISGNDGSGVSLSVAGATNNVVAGNLIGLNAAGTSALGNSQAGVAIVNASGNRVGGLTAAERNVISGNGTEGVAVTGIGATNNVVQGNYIGTDAAGSAAVPNGSFGVSIAEGSNNLIGGTAPGAGNVISGGARDGVGITGVSNNNNQVVGNLIGLNAAGTAALGNALNGVFVSAGGNNLIRGNVISGNGQSGVALADSTTGNQVQGNRIGTDPTGTAARPNLGHGVLVSGGANGNVIGSDGNGVNDAAEGNAIAFNALMGVTVTGAGTTGNAIRRNFIDSNGGLGIDLNAGGNNAQAAPAITGVVPGMSTSLSGKMTGAPNTTYTLEFYTSPTADPSGYGEGKRYLGSITVTTDAAGNVAFSTILIGVSTVRGEVITATATDPGGNTSEFSLAVVAKATTQVLVTAVNNLPDIPQKGALLSKLANIQSKIDADRPDVAINMLNAFINGVAAILPPEQAALLIDLAALLIDELDG